MRGDRLRADGGSRRHGAGSPEAVAGRQPVVRKERVLEVLGRAAAIDEHLALFGARAHRYALNPVASRSLVRAIEDDHGFTLPEDYARFIVEVGDGGACAGYGLTPFAELAQAASSPDAERFREAYLQSLSEPFCPRRMASSEVASFGFAKEAYEESPGDYYVLDQPDGDESPCGTKGYLVLGTYGCQWDYGIVVAGELKGKVFDTDNEGGFALVAESFDAFYQNWLDGLEEHRLRERLEGLGGVRAASASSR